MYLLARIENRSPVDLVFPAAQRVAVGLTVVKGGGGDVGLVDKNRPLHLDCTDANCNRSSSPRAPALAAAPAASSAFPPARFALLLAD